MEQEKEQEKKNIIKEIFNEILNYEIIQNKCLEEILLNACLTGNIPLIQKLLKIGVNVNCSSYLEDAFETTPLNEAIKGKDPIPICKLLLENGSNKGESNQAIITAVQIYLHSEKEQLYYDLVELLLKNGINPLASLDVGPMEIDALSLVSDVEVSSKNEKMALLILKYGISRYGIPRFKSTLKECIRYARHSRNWNLVSIYEKLLKE